MSDFHPRELSRYAVEKWLEDFKKKLKRTTSRDDLDRLILSVERYEVEKSSLAGWEEVLFENGKGKVDTEYNSEEWFITSFQKMILEKNPEKITEYDTGRYLNYRHKNGQIVVDTLKVKFSLEIIYLKKGPVSFFGLFLAKTLFLPRLP